VSGDVVYCVECGQAVAPGASFCKACGARQSPEEAPAAAATSTAAQPASNPGNRAREAPRVAAADMPPPSGPPRSAVPDWQRSLSSSLSFSRDEWLLAGCTLVLFIDLLALPWFEVSAGPYSVSFTATQSPDGWLGVLAVLGCVALFADLLVDRLSPHTPLPVIGGSRAMTRLLIAAVTSGLVALKFILHVHFSLFAAGFYLAFILAIGLVVFAALAHANETPRPGA
jgi:hypothetical protein